jgi:hypothetical protein
MTIEEAYAAYEATLPRLELARVEHDEAWKETQAAYKRWVGLGGDHHDEPGYGKDNVT